MDQVREPVVTVAGAAGGGAAAATNPVAVWTIAAPPTRAVTRPWTTATREPLMP